MSWVKTVLCSELQRRPVVFQHPPKQVALFSVAGSVYAVDNRCPHEGYPLVEGQVDGACNAHLQLAQLEIPPQRWPLHPRWRQRAVLRDTR